VLAILDQGTRPDWEGDFRWSFNPWTLQKVD